MKVLVTGGTGLVGSHAIERLVQVGHQVRAMVRSDEGHRLVASLGAEPVPGRVEEPQSWKAAAGSEAIVHAAAMVTTPTTWEAYQQVNILGTRLAAETAARLDARLVHVSSVAVYGRRPDADDTQTITEETPFSPIAEANFYARSKREAEQAVWKVASKHDLSAVALRPCVIYGERERLFMARLLRLLRFGVAPVVGSGHNRLSVIYVGNVVDALVSALDHPTVTGPFNTANDGGLTPREFYQIIEDVTGRHVRQIRIPLLVTTAVGTAWLRLSRMLRPGSYTGLGSSSGHFMARENPYSSRRAERELDWRPSTPPVDAFRQTVRWFVEHEQ
jgi:nucleoside-diphosphate-sugar epimerase